MIDQPSVPPAEKPSPVLSALIFIVAVALMVWLRLDIYQERFIALSYGLPLLICLWHKDRRLLWAMAASFLLISAYKPFWLVQDHNAPDYPKILQWLFQAANVMVIACTVHFGINLTARLQAQNAALERANREIAHQNEALQAQSREVATRNQELQQQAEERALQNEELQRQSEELEHQAQELQAQSEELRLANQELNQRESMLQTILGSLRDVKDEREVVARICQALVQLIGEPAAAAAVVEKLGTELFIRTHAGSEDLGQERYPFEGSFASVVMAHDRTAFVDDLQARPDLKALQPRGRSFRSVLATPLRIQGKPIGAVKVFSHSPQQWTSQHFRIIEWVAVQAALALEAVRLQDQLRRSEANLAHANALLEQKIHERTARLQEAMGELEHFSYTITHDMRAPLRAILGFAGVLKDAVGDSLNAEAKDSLERIMISAARMDRLITDALNYSKTVRQELSLAPVNAEELLRTMIGSYPAFQPPKAEIRIESPIPPVLANEAGLTQCFSNLLGNAVKFVEPGKIPRVRIHAELAREPKRAIEPATAPGPGREPAHRDGLVRLWFEDNGIGIAEQAQGKIFEMFQRVSKEYEGTGVGLALVKKVVQRMGGDVGVESQPGEGSRFWVELPLVPKTGKPAHSP